MAASLSRSWEIIPPEEMKKGAARFAACPEIARNIIKNYIRTPETHADIRLKAILYAESISLEHAAHKHMDIYDTVIERVQKRNNEKAWERRIQEARSHRQR